MSFFKKVEGEAAILVNRGTFTQTDIYSRDGYLFAAVGKSFVRIMADGSTSKANVYVDFMTFGAPLAQKLGRLCMGEVNGGKWLDEAAERRLLGTEN